MAKTLADILGKARERSQKHNKEKTVKPAAGKSVWRILPGWNKSEPLNFFQPFGQHWVKDLDGNIKAVVVCPEKSGLSATCDICETVSDAAKNAPDDATREAIRESRATQVYLMNAIQVDGDASKVQILQLGTMAFNSVLDALEEYGEDMLDAEKGNDIIIARDGTGMSTKYTVTVRPASKSKPVAKSILMNLHDLSEYVKEDFEAKKVKALEVLGMNSSALGIAGPATSGAAALTSSAASLEEELDDEIPDFDADTTEDDTTEDDAGVDGTTVEDAEIVDETAKEMDDKFGEDLSDDELDSLLADI